MQCLKPLPIGIQTFETIINDKKLYIDKTPSIYDLIKEGRARYFLSRPRRFGKSLLLSTLESVFRGKKDLFKGLAIDHLPYDWLEYPVIRLDMSEVASNSEKNMIEGLIKRLTIAAEAHGITLNTKQLPHEVFIDLINLTVEKTGKKVVVLIDEYDSPIVNQLQQHELVHKLFEILREFYRVTKSNDSQLQFVMVAGVTNFAKANMFSGLNHLHNITFNQKYASICGYTQDELEVNFKDYLHEVIAHSSKKQNEMLAEIQNWYNGYRFAANAVTVYNPFSVLQFFADKQFSNYWYQTGTPSFLIKAISGVANLQPTQFENIKAYASNFDTLVVEKPTILPLLFQTGYLTIKNYDEHLGIYELGYPNQEVKQSFLRSLLV